MLDQSILAKDKRSESRLILGVSLLLIVELLLSVFNVGEIWPITGVLVVILNQGVAFAAGVLVTVWTFLRLVRLRRKRSFFFFFGLLCWFFLFVLAVLSQIAVGAGYPWVIALSPFLAYIGFLGAVSLLSKWGSHDLIARFGWPVMKSAHWLYFSLIVILGVFELLSVWQILAFGAVGVYCMFRYGYNRWIYGAGVIYPFKKTAAKFYVRQLSRSDSHLYATTKAC